MRNRNEAVEMDARDRPHHRRKKQGEQVALQAAEDRITNKLPRDEGWAAEGKEDEGEGCVQYAQVEQEDIPGRPGHL